MSEWLKESRQASGESVYTGNCIVPIISGRIPQSPVVQHEIFFVYILQSLKDNSFYIGQCDDLDYRMSKHHEGMSKYTASKRPLRLVYFEAFNSRSEAIKREREIKKKKSSKYIQFLISSWQKFI